MWICSKCGKEMDSPQICWGMDGGNKVDIIDCFCPYCPSNELIFQGTKEEEDAWWDIEWSK